MDAGDTLWLGPRHLAIGLGWRTNARAAEQLTRLLHPQGVEVEVYDLPSFAGEEFCLHLMSLISLVSPSLAVAYPELMPVRLLRALERRGLELVVSPRAEFDRLSTNILALRPGHVVALAGNPDTTQQLVSAGVRVETLEAPDLCLAGVGGPTCLTRPLHRTT